MCGGDPQGRRLGAGKGLALRSQGLGVLGEKPGDAGTRVADVQAVLNVLLVLISLAGQGARVALSLLWLAPFAPLRSPTPQSSSITLEVFRGHLYHVLP